MHTTNRAIVIFPQLENITLINELRQQYDPLAVLIAPHITLVFPFESDFSSQTLLAHIQTATHGFHPFSLQLQGITASEGEYLFLNVKQGDERLIELHDRLYSGLLAVYLSNEHIYHPHLTLGHLKDKVEFLGALEATRNIKTVFQTMVETIIIFRLGDHPAVEASYRLD